MAATGLRIRLLEPSCGAITGGTRLTIHGRGFRPLPHSLLVRFRLATDRGKRVEVTGRFLLETQVECVVPDFRADALLAVAKHTNLAPSSATVAFAPFAVPLLVEVILDSDEVSNTLQFALHPELAINRISPQAILMNPVIKITATTNLLKLSASQKTSLYPAGSDTARLSEQQPGSSALVEIATLPVYVRVRQLSERTGAISERVVEARWSISAVGVYEIEFDAVMMAYGEAAVEVTMNRCDFVNAQQKSVEARGYRVYRDIRLTNLEPCCISVTNGKMTEMRIIGEGFVDSGDLVVRLLQKEITDTALNKNNVQFLPVAQLNATYVNQQEIRCSVHPNMSFGLTHVQVSLNGGRQFGRDFLVALLHRDRTIDDISPSHGSLGGGMVAVIHYSRLTVEDVDAPYQVEKLTPPRRVRVRFQALDDIGQKERLTKTVTAEVVGGEHKGRIQFRTPSFLDEIKAHLSSNKPKDKNSSEPKMDIWRFQVSVTLSGDTFFGNLQFKFFLPPVIRSISQHHGPMTGGTIIRIRMKHRVPSHLPVQVRFLSLGSGTSLIVDGRVAPESVSDEYVTRVDGNDQTSVEDACKTILCVSPQWTDAQAGKPQLTKIQVSLDGGFEFVPPEDPHERAILSTSGQPHKGKAIPALVKDMTYLYFLFYPVPRLTSVIPMSADIQGGSFITIGGENVVDHGGQISLIFQSEEMSRKVSGFVENAVIRCCVPPFNVGRATVFVSLNGEQYTKCEFVDPDSKRKIDFVYYSSPSLSRLSPICACISQSSIINIFGVNLIETGRIKVRFGFVNSHGKMMYKDAPGKARDGVISVSSPLFSSDFGDMNAVVDVALNGNDFSGTTLKLYFYSCFRVIKVDPPVGAFEIPIDLVVHLSQPVVSDLVLVQIRFRKRGKMDDTSSFGPVPVSSWEASRLRFTLPPLTSYLENLDILESAFLDISFDGTYFHHAGEILEHYRVYSLPNIISASPLFGPYDQETEVTAKMFDSERPGEP
ncbi:hypothetical protein PINS_up021430 [Pythium insidiosum]|nr:hypothetical protein PINS_up021430 [Pythium insidiosum]